MHNKEQSIDQIVMFKNHDGGVKVDGSILNI